jgi:hypothetical protein
MSSHWELPEPSDSKIWSWVPWDSEPRITVLARAISNLAVSNSWFRAPSEFMSVFLFWRLLRVLKWGLILGVRRGLTATGHSPLYWEWLERAAFPTLRHTHPVFMILLLKYRREHKYTIESIFWVLMKSYERWENEVKRMSTERELRSVRTQETDAIN